MFILDDNNDVIKGWWYNGTYDISDILSTIKEPGLWDQTNETIIDRTGYYESINVDIKTVHGAYGRCYSIYLLNTLKAEGDFYAITVNMSLVKELTFYVHEPYNEVGLLWSFWPVDPVTFSLRSKEQVILTIQKDTYTPRITSSMFPCSSDNEYSYPKCVTDWVKREYVGSFKKHNRTGKSLGNNNTHTCVITSRILFQCAGILLDSLWLNKDPENILPCSTEEDEHFARAKGYNLMEVLENQESTQCQRRCQQTIWNVKVSQEPSAGIQKRMAVLYLESTMKSERSEEVLINDLNTVIASVGGSLGLFLGVSCFSMFTYLGRSFTSRRRKDKHSKKHKRKSSKVVTHKIFKRSV